MAEKPERKLHDEKKLDGMFILPACHILLMAPWQCDAIAQHFELQTAEPPEDGLTAYVKRDSDGQKIAVFSFVPPVAGMFVWQKYHLAQNREYLAKKDTMEEREAIAEWSVNFWKKLIENTVSASYSRYRPKN